MVKGETTVAKIASLIAAIAAALILGGMRPDAQAQTVGWTCLPNYNGCEPGTGGLAANATVGLPFERRLVAGCNTGQWTYGSVELQTGRLPPGLDFDSTFNIVGVPTRGGSFSFQLLFHGLLCPGSEYLPEGDWSSPYTIVVTGN
ncbi:MAG: hypothetical protein ACREEE_13990 [Dongiaceae bacterium]